MMPYVHVPESGGIELGLSLVIPNFHPVCFIEKDPYCQRVLVARHPNTSIWDDVKTWPASDWKGVAFFTAGFPCQPSSLAGERKGALDARWLWPKLAEHICVVRPRFVFLENVPGLFSGPDTGRTSTPVSGRLNPEFVEWLMGYPPGYSDPTVEPDLGPWEIACRHLLQRRLGSSYLGDLA